MSINYETDLTSIEKFIVQMIDEIYLRPWSMVRQKKAKVMINFLETNKHSLDQFFVENELKNYKSILPRIIK